VVDCTDIRTVRKTLTELTEKVGRRLRAMEKTATVGTIKVRFGDFRTITRQQPLPKPTNSDRDLLQCARELLDRAQIGGQPIRLVGFGVTGLRGPNGLENPRQPLLLKQNPDPNEQQNRALDAVVDELRNRYGVDILKRAWWPEDDQ
jgi:DNA polymerase-4